LPDNIERYPTDNGGEVVAQRFDLISEELDFQLDLGEPTSRNEAKAKK
jgi:methyl coenzyme M reductase gamma subunit